MSPLPGLRQVCNGYCVLLRGFGEFVVVVFPGFRFAAPRAIECRPCRGSGRCATATGCCSGALGSLLLLCSRGSASLHPGLLNVAPAGAQAGVQRLLGAAPGLWGVCCCCVPGVPLRCTPGY